MISHTATLLHMPTMHRLRVTWSFERADVQFGIPRCTPAWPDTETCLNLVLRATGARPLLVGKEENYKRYRRESRSRAQLPRIGHLCVRVPRAGVRVDGSGAAGGVAAGELLASDRSPGLVLQPQQRPASNLNDADGHRCSGPQCSGVCVSLPGPDPRPCFRSL